MASAGAAPKFRIDVAINNLLMHSNPKPLGLPRPKALFFLNRFSHSSRCGLKTPGQKGGDTESLCGPRPA